jgi:hypothetical protein
MNEELMTLIDLITTQQAEITSLRNQIISLKRKEIAAVQSF